MRTTAAFRFFEFFTIFFSFFFSTFYFRARVFSGSLQQLSNGVINQKLPDGGPVQSLDRIPRCQPHLHLECTTLLYGACVCTARAALA